MSETLTVSDPSRSRPLTGAVPVRTLQVLVNPLSGSVGAGAVDEMRALLDDYPVEAMVTALTAEEFAQQVDAAFAAEPDVLVVLAGDGTAGTVAGRAGPDGPLVVTLPGGTMNMLPKALYGTTDWKQALRQALEAGVEYPVAGGRVEDGGEVRKFFCAAILGAPALWAPAREAIRTGRFRQAWGHVRLALKRAFNGRLRYRLEATDAFRRAEALVLISPLISKSLNANEGLEAAAMTTADASEAFRLAAHALFDDWRHDPAVRTRATQVALVRARSRIPAVIDGEPMRLASGARIRFEPRAFRALAPRDVVAALTSAESQRAA